jgi:carbonic anhydrase
MDAGKKHEPHPETPDEAVATLLEGNARHVSGERQLRDHSPADPAEGQQPFAAIVACSDSRVAPPLIFDVERGNLFESRIAGNGVDAGVLGSTEFAVAKLGVKVVVVLGHTGCAAVSAAIEVASGDTSFSAEETGEIGAVIDNVVPGVAELGGAERDIEHAVPANARYQAARLASADPVIKPAVESGALKVVAAVYDVASGEVSLLPE